MNIAPIEQKRDIRALINSDVVKNQLAMVLPKHLTADRMARVAITAILKTPKLMQCKPESLLQALMLCSQTGLEPDGRNAHLIPYGDTVQVIFDYKGLIALAERNGVKNIRAVAVCEKDEFSFSIEDGNPKLHHVIDWKSDRGSAYAYYGTCIRNDQFDVEVMTKAEVDKIRQRSKASGSGPWTTDYDEMAKKTVLRRMSKRWDISPEAFDAINQEFDSPSDIKQPTKPVVLSPLVLPETTQDAPSETAPSTPSQPANVVPIKPQEQQEAKKEPSDQDGDLGPASDPATSAPQPAESQQTQSPATPPPGAANAAQPVDASKLDGAQCLAMITDFTKRDGVTMDQVMKFLYAKKVADPTKHKELSELSTAKLQSIVNKWSDILAKMKA